MTVIDLLVTNFETVASSARLLSTARPHAKAAPAARATTLRIMPIKAYGTWESPLSSEVLARGNVRYGSLQYAHDGSLYVSELRSFEQGRSAIVRLHAAGREDVLPSGCSARSRVHEYGARSFLIQPDRLYFVQQSDQQLYQLELGSELPKQLTAQPETRFAVPIADASRSRLIAVAERHAAGREPENFIASIALPTGAVEPLIQGRAFYADPTLSPDGRTLAFLCWDHPHMPWDAAELWSAQLSPQGEVLQLEHIAGNQRASTLQPTFGPDGRLYFALEVDGYWNLHRLDSGRVERLTNARAELGAPLWGLGVQNWGFLDAQTVAGIQFVRGNARLVRIALDEGGAISTLAPDLPYLGQLVTRPAERAEDAEVVVATGWAGSGAELIRITPRGTRETLASAHSGLLDSGDVSEPEPIEFETSRAETAHGFFYPPKNARWSAPDGTKPPLIVLVHGGPTASTSTALSPAIQFFTTRGFAVFDVNYRGSSGFGRAYRDRLRGEWGVLDVDDCIAGARFLADSGRVDGRHLLIRGGSAGGYTVLQALLGDSVFAAGSCHYGISDLEALTRDTHKFESHYDRFLIGPYPERRDLFVERSPIHHVDRIARPVVFFQGLDDKVVPADQTERMAEALRGRGIAAEYHAYAGEQHGFRKADTIRHVLETELAFFRRILKLE